MNKPLKLLMVEDSEDDATLSLRALRAGGFDPTHRRVQTAAELRTALAQERWDAVISDFNMPGFTGADALGIFRSTGLDIPFILISGTIGEETAVNAMKAGASDYLMKKSLARLAPALKRELKEAQIREDHRRAQRDLIESAAGLHRAQLMAKLAHVVSGPDGSFERWSETLPQLAGVEPAQLPTTTRAWLNILHPDDRSLFREKAIEAAINKLRTEFEYRLRRADGECIYVRQTIEPLKAEEGDSGGSRWFSTMQDVTAEKKTEGKIKRLNRVYAVLSGINTLIVRVHDRDELFREACRIAVQSGQFPLAWVALADPRNQQVKAVAWAGDERGFVQFTRPTVGAKAVGKAGLSARAIANLEPAICNDIAGDGGALRYPKEALERGYRSAVALPLVVDGTAVGALVLYAAEPGFFDDAEMKLLVELAGDISFALENINRQKKLDKLARIRAVSSEINAAILRIRDRQELLEATCNIAVEQAGFPLAWIAMLDPVTQDLKPAAMAGAVLEYAKLLAPSIYADRAAGRGTNGRAFREQQPVVDNDMALNPDKGFMRGEALKRGIQAAMSLPLLIEGASVGVMALYAKEKDYFDEEEIGLLTEVAGNISFALANISRQQKLDKLARIRAVSSEINAAIVRIHDREALLRETCRIAVEYGKFELVWIALVDQEKQCIQPVAWAGFSSEIAQDYHWTRLNQPGVTLAEAIRTRKVAVRNDFDSNMTAGPLRQEAMKQGYCSTVCVPFMVDNSVVAAIILFAVERGFFDAEELALLTEAAADVSFALQAIDKQARLDYLAYYDVLTGLANRSLFLERVGSYMRSAVSGGHKLALFVIDLERFKNINDSLGQSAGDALLKQVAEWLTRTVGDAHLVARVGADHFAVVLPEVKREGSRQCLEETIETFLEHPFHLNDAVFRVAAKAGIALFPDDGASADILFRNAEAALKKAKASGERHLFYTKKMTETVAGMLTLENQLRQALDNEEFVLHYQPKVNLASGKVTSAEALIRWNDPRTGLVPPGQFIPVLEETGLIYDVGRWALRQAIEDYLRWRAAGLAAVRIAVNVSPLQLRNRGFIAEIKQAIGIDPHAAAGLELEITESVIMDDVKHNIASLEAIRALGLTVAIDDFGTGFSSLSYLSKLPVDTLKIDRSFVTDMTAAQEGLALVSTIITLAHSMKLKVVAEGVETEEQSRLLRLLNCDEMQGFLFSKAVPREVFETRYLAPAPGPATKRIKPFMPAISID